MMEQLNNTFIFFIYIHPYPILESVCLHAAKQALLEKRTILNVNLKPYIFPRLLRIVFPRIFVLLK